MPETSNHSPASPLSDTHKIIARGHTAIEIGQYLLPSNQPVINTLSGKRADLANQLEEAGRRLEASGNDELKIRWDWKQRTEAEEGEGEMVDLMKESGMRVLDVIEAVWDWLRLQDDENLSIDPKEFLLDLTERRHLQRLVSLIPSRLILPHINDLLRASTQAASSIDSHVISSIRTITTRLLRLITIPSQAQNQDDNQAQCPYRQSDLYMFLSSPTIIPFILLPPLLIGWSQAFPPVVFAETRKGFLEYVDKGLEPSEALATLGGLQTILTSGNKSTSWPSSGGGTGSGSSAGAKIVPLEDDPIVYPEYARRTVKALMGRQMVRPGGVAGLLGNVFGFGGRKDGKSGDDVLELHKLDYVTKLLGIPVHGMDAKAYYDNIFEQLRLIIVPSDPARERNTPKHHVQASAYVLTRLAVTSPLIKRELQKTLHEPLFPRFEDLPSAAPSSSSSSSTQESVVVTSATRINSLVSLLLPLLMLNPPPPPFLNLIMTPIIRPIFLLWQHLKQDKTADPLTRKEIEDVIGAWVRLMDVELVENGLWEVMQGGRGWKGPGFGGGMDDEGKVLFWGRNVGPSESTEEEDIGAAVLYGRPAQSTTDDLKFSSDPENFDLTTKLNDVHVSDDATVPDAGQDYDILPDLSSLQTYPDPELLVAIIVKSGRADLSSRFLVRCLQAYQVMSGDNDANPERTLILLQVIMRLSDRASANLGKEVRHVLLFIEHALRPSSTADEIDMADSDDGADSDDEDVDDAAEPAAANEVVKEDIPNLGLVETALNLLIATLHGDESITSESQPILKPIEKHVEALLRHRLVDIRQAARAASLLLAVRKATPGLASDDSTTGTARRYQESLRLLQDPILAVRAHGLIILQSIVRAPDFDRALTPAIMDIFLSAIRDDDSFMYLNAVKGLSSLVDGLGREVMASITLAYVEGFEGITEFKPDELDRRLRLGEALQQSIRRAGTALSGYVQPIVPRLLRVFPNASLPTVIRSSSLSILATCADTEWRALLPWSNDLIGSCLDLLRLESVSQRRNQSNSIQPDNNRESGDKDENAGEEDDDERPINEPTRSNDSKHPALRRAAVVFLGLMFDSVAKAAAQDTDNDTNWLRPEIRMNTRPATSQKLPAPVDSHLVQTARTVLSYIKHTDVDSLTSHQAGEVLQILRHIPASI